MQPAPSPLNEIERLRALRECCVLDTGSESAFDDLTRLAAFLCDTPMALVSLVDESRQWFKSAYGIQTSETPRSISFCGHAILAFEPMVITDATKDERFHDNPLVTGAPHIRFYAGMPLLTSDGLALGTLCVSDTKPRDITDRQLEHLAALARQASTQLELQRTARKLSKARIAADAASKAKTEFLANMSHEVRTPLTAVLGFAELLDQDEYIQIGPKHIVEFIATIRQSGDDLLTILNDILDLARIESGKMEVERIALPAEPFLTGVTTGWRRRAESKGLRFELDIAADVPKSLQVDPVRTRQVLTHMLSNAVKFTSEGFVRLEVACVEGAPQSVRFDIVDSGAGIDLAHQRMMFEPFTQADFSITRQFGGTGLGLTLCKRLAELLGGDVTLVESSPGQGSRFRFQLDAIAALSAHDNGDGLLNETGKTNRCRLEGVRILVAEDNVYNTKLLTLMLEPEGAIVAHEPDGRAASDRALQATADGAPFDIVLMDMQMPDMDGYTATRLLREKGYDAPIVAVTAHAMVGDRERCLAAGCNEYVSKPVNRSRLIDVCVDLLAQVAVHA